MLAADLSRVVVMSAMAAAVFTGAPPIAVYVLSAFMSIGSGAFRPAQASLLPLLAESPEELTAANVTSSAIDSVGAFVGPALGGLILAVSSVGWVFVVDALALVWSASFVLQVHSDREPPPPRERRRMWAEIAAGFRALGSESDARVIVALYFSQTVVAGALRVLIVVTALDLLDVGNSGLGFLNAALGVGGLLGIGVTVGLVGRQRLAADFGIGLVLIGAGLALIGVWPTVLGTVILLAIFGVGNTLVDVSGVTLMQRAVHDEVLGRVFGALQSILVFGLALGALIAPPLINLIGTRASLIAVGALLPLLALLLWRRLSAIDVRARIAAEHIALLRANPIFEPLPEPTVEQLAAKLTPVAVRAGESVIREGDHGDRFYVVEDGRCEVSVDGEKVARRLAGRDVRRDRAAPRRPTDGDRHRRRGDEAARA